MRYKLLGDRNFITKLMRLTFPIALQSLMLASVAAGDAIMLGRVEQNAMAAVSLATQVQFVQNMIISSVTGTVTILGAQYWGKGDRPTVNDLFCMSIKICGIVSLLVAAACCFLIKRLLKFSAHRIAAALRLRHPIAAARPCHFGLYAV